MVLAETDFRRWLDAYAEAWKSLEPERAGPLFTEDAEYRWTPFDAPLHGRAAIVAAWRRAFENQALARMNSEPLAVAGPVGIAHWRTTVQRPGSGAVVDLDGILVAKFATPGKCRVFREWWHTTDPGYAGGPART